VRDSYSAISTILALWGGIKEVRNMFVMASTDRLKVMDDGVRIPSFVKTLLFYRSLSSPQILRRFSGKFFVGRPTVAQRRETFQHVCNFFVIFLSMLMHHL
jgi:SpoVK/Ycf46/Vps4 family AAA+-type ATPase